MLYIYIIYNIYITYLYIFNIEGLVEFFKYHLFLIPYIYIYIYIYI